MTTNAPPVDSPDTPPQRPEYRSWGDITFDFARQIASESLSPGDRAELRRMDPDTPDAAVFWRLMASHDLLGNPELEGKWALILHGIALMTRRNSAGDNSGTAHDGYISVGRALFLGGEPHREKGFYSETRLNRLLTARGAILRILLARMFRMLASADVSFNWREMAQFILSEGYDDEASEQARRRIASEYYLAERRSSQASDV